MGEYKRVKKEQEMAKSAIQKAATAVEQEKRKKLAVEKREMAIAHFRDAHGQLTGAIVCCFPGWRGVSKYLEVSGQQVAMYYDPEGRKFSLLKDIEQMFGTRMLEGQPIPDIDAARNNVKVDENGRTVNVARQENFVSEFEVDAVKELKKIIKKRKFRHVNAEDYHETDLLVAPLKQLQPNRIPNSKELQRNGAEVQRHLEKRGFGGETELLFVGNKKAATEKSSPVLEALRGVYFKKKDFFGGRPCYQRVLPPQDGTERLTCVGTYLFWSRSRCCWKLGSLNDGLAGFAICPEDQPTPESLSSKWQLCKPHEYDTVSATTLDEFVRK